MSQIAFSSPFTRNFTHSDQSVGTTATQILAPVSSPSQKRVMLVVQNKSDTAIVQVIFSATGSVGLELQPNQSVSIENYNGAVRCISDTASTTVHVAQALI